MKVIRRGLTILGLLGVFVGGVVAPTQASATEPAGAGTYADQPEPPTKATQLPAIPSLAAADDSLVLRIAHVRMSHSCMAVPGGSKDPGSALIVWGCGTWLDHYWEVREGTTGWELRNFNSGLCATMKLHAQGYYQVEQDYCRLQDNQQWSFDYYPDSVMFEIRNGAHNRCLAPYEEVNGAVLSSVSCSGDWHDPTYWYLYDY